MENRVSPTSSRARRSVIAGLALLACGGAADRVDVLLVGGSVYTLDWPAPDGEDGRPSPASSWTEAHGWRATAEALAVADGRVVWLGSGADAEDWRARADRVIDLQGAAVIPGLANARVRMEAANGDLSDDDVAARLTAVLAARVAAGFTGAQVAGAASATIAALERLERAGRLPIRVNVLLSAADTGLLENWRERGPDTVGLVQVRTIDLESGSARKVADLAGLVGAGFQLAIHVDTDDAAAVLDGLASLPGARLGRHRLAGAAAVGTDANRLADLGVIVSIRPGAGERARTLRLAGVPVLFDTDADIFSALAATVPSLTAEEAIRAWTAVPAFAAFREAGAGSIAPGRIADLTALRPDPFTTEPASWVTGRIVLTILGGRVMYERRGM